MWSLSHSVVHPRQVRGARIVVTVAKQDHKATPKVPSQMPMVEIEATHADWIFGGKVGQHVDPTVCSDGPSNRWGISERKISQHVLRASGVAKQTEGPSA